MSTVLDEWRAAGCVELNSALDNKDNDAATANASNTFINRKPTSQHSQSIKELKIKNYKLYIMYVSLCLPMCLYSVSLCVHHSINTVHYEDGNHCFTSSLSLWNKFRSIHFQRCKHRPFVRKVLRSYHHTV